MVNPFHVLHFSASVGSKCGNMLLIMWILLVLAPTPLVFLAVSPLGELELCCTVIDHMEENSQQGLTSEMIILQVTLVLHKGVILF